MDFVPGAPVNITTSAMTVVDCPATISDSVGNLLFYSNAQEIWDRTNQVMPNGNGIIGATSGGQPGVVIRQPGSSNLYYLFTNDGYGGPDGLRYDLIDMNLHGGLGDVVAGQKNVLLIASASEQVLAAKDANGHDAWIITHPFNSGTFNVYHITAAGINTTPVVSTVGANRGGASDDATGQITIDTGYRRIAMAHYYTGEFELYDFDNSTGIVSNVLTFSSSSKPWGIEISPDGSKLYVCGWTTQYVKQYDLSNYTQAAIDASVVNLGNVTGPGAPYYTGYMQRAPDGKIYIAVYLDSYLAVINNPNSAGLASNLVDNGYSLGAATCQAGLPNKVVVTPFCNAQSAISRDTSLCSGQTIALDAGISGTGYLWSTGATTQSITVNRGGIYTVTVSTGVCRSENSIRVVNPGSVSLGGDTVICGNTGLTLSPGVPDARYHWQDNSTDSVYYVLSSGIYAVTITTNCGINTSQKNVVIYPNDCMLSIPTGFSPNGDGKNDVFRAVSYCPVDKFSMQVYDRWGQLIFESNDITEGWDGTFKGKNQPLGVFVYTAQFYNKCKGAMDKVSGNVTLLR